jgi:pimeloyl-ACP methyl ester carboxylesterase
MPELKQNNHTIYYETHGQGPALILIRGLGSSAVHWYAQVPALSQYFQVIIFDNRGIGRSDDDGEPFTIHDMAEDTVCVLDALHIERAHVLGVSLGGMIAQEMAIAYPQRVNRLILVVTHCGGVQHIKATDEVLDIIRRLAEEDSLETKTRAATVFFAPMTIKEKGPILRAFAAASAQYPAGPEIIKRQMLAVAQHNTYDRLHQIQAPTLVIAGDEDILIPPENAAILSNQIPHAKLLNVPGGGHQILIEQPQICNQEIINFLQHNGRCL